MKEDEINQYFRKMLKLEDNGIDKLVFLDKEHEKEFYNQDEDMLKCSIGQIAKTMTELTNKVNMESIVKMINKHEERIHELDKKLEVYEEFMKDLSSKSKEMFIIQGGINNNLNDQIQNNVSAIIHLAKEDISK